MTVYFYLAVVIAALYGVAKVLLPEMAKPPLPQPDPEQNSFEVIPYDQGDKRMEKLETLLAEKNRTIDLLEMESKVFHAQVSSFEKVKTLLEGEIHRLREQNRIFRSELGLPAAQPKENSIT